MIINGTERNGKMNTFDNKKQFSQMFIRQNECCLCLLRSPSAISYRHFFGNVKTDQEKGNFIKSFGMIIKMIINGTERNGKMNTYDNKKQFSPMFIRQKEKNVC